MSANEQSISAARRVAGNILIGLPGFALIGSAAAKLVHVPKVVEQMAASGFAGERLTFIAVLEVFCAVLFLIPSTRAAATHLQHGQSVAQPGVFLAVLWVGAWLRHPQILWSISASTLGTIPYSTADRRPRAHGQI
jgi:hypothetical protein